MARVLYLVHRLPYPPDKGDKVRSYHLLRHLAARHEVVLGTFVDDPDDEPHVATVRQWCADVHAVRLNPAMARIRSLGGLWSGEPLSLAYYRDAGMHAWIRSQLAGAGLDAALVFSSSMAQYVHDLRLPTLVDFVDVDSAKWSAYADAHRWPLSWFYRREGRHLLAYERTVAATADAVFLVTDKEADLFKQLAPESAHHVEAVGNGVDADYFEADPARRSPFPADELPIVFTGAMDYWPNIDAVCWFVQDVLPTLRERWPSSRFHIVGRNPAPAVRALASDAVAVTGTVPDVRPYLQHAAAVVAPLRLARGIQNKVLEAMAMARPVIVAANCAQAIDAHPGDHFLVAETVQDYVHALGALLKDRAGADALGQAGREHVIKHYGWSARLSTVDRHLNNLKAMAVA